MFCDGCQGGFLEKVSLKKKHIVGGVAFWNLFTPIGSYVNENEKKIVK